MSKSVEYKLKNKEAVKKYQQRQGDRYKEAHKKSSSKYNRNNKDWYANHQLRWRYGITKSIYDEMLLTQNSLCKICIKPETEIYKGKIKLLSVDHCHVTNKVRGLLCAKCNKGLGCFIDSNELLQNAINYLKENQEKD